MNLRVVSMIMLIAACIPGTLLVAQAVPASQCIECHAKLTPNIVSDWKLSKHSQVEVTCVTCHGDQHHTASDVAKVKIPTPDTCAHCHQTQVEQFKNGKHAMAWAAMKAMPTIHWQPMAMIEGMKGCGGCHKIGVKPPSRSHAADSRRGFGAASCDSCHTRHTFSVDEAQLAASVRDLPHGFRPSAVGDVFVLQARRTRRTEAD